MEVIQYIRYLHYFAVSSQLVILDLQSLNTQSEIAKRNFKVRPEISPNLSSQLLLSAENGPIKVVSFLYNKIIQKCSSLLKIVI